MTNSETHKMTTTQQRVKHSKEDIQQNDDKTAMKSATQTGTHSTMMMNREICQG